MEALGALNSILCRSLSQDETSGSFPGSNPAAAAFDLAAAQVAPSLISQTSKDVGKSKVLQVILSSSSSSSSSDHHPCTLMKGMAAVAVVVI